MGPLNRRAIKAQSDNQSRPRSPRYLLRRQCDVGRGNGADPEIRDHGEVAERISDTIAVSCDRQSAGGNHDAMAAPFIQVAFALGLLTRRFRRVSLIAAVTMHAFILTMF